MKPALEIRSVAVHPACSGKGFWQRLVAALVERCRDLGLPKVFAFTLAAPFFSRCGFSEFKREDMPAIVWVECSKCPKFYRKQAKLNVHSRFYSFYLDLLIEIWSAKVRFIIV